MTEMTLSKERQVSKTEEAEILSDFRFLLSLL